MDLKQIVGLVLLFGLFTMDWTAAQESGGADEQGTVRQSSQQAEQVADAPTADFVEGEVGTRGFGATTTVVMGSVPPAGHSRATVTVPGSDKLVGGGAFADWKGAGSLLTSSAPTGMTGWEATAKDHGMPDPSALTAYGILLADPSNNWEVTMREATSPVMPHPMVSVTTPPGYVMASGGCRVNWKTAPTSPGNLLTASFPSSNTTWECRAKDHSFPNPASVTAYVVAIRPRGSAPLPQIQIDQATSAAGASPTVQVRPSRPGYVVTGGGAQTIVSPTGGGQLLTQSAPLLGPGNTTPIGWMARSKDHLVPSPGTVIAYVISLNLSMTTSGVGTAQVSPAQPLMLQPMAAVPGTTGGMTQAQAIKAYVDALPRLALVQSRPSTLSPIPREGVQGTWLSGGTYVNQRSELALLKSPSSVIWPGALVQGASIAGNNFALIDLGRSPGRIVVKGNFIGGTAAPRWRDLPRIIGSDVDQARDSILRAVAPTDAASDILLDTQFAGTMEEAMIKLGVAYQGVAFNASLKASFNQSLNEHTLVAKFTQKFYDVVFEKDPTSVSPFFGPTVTLTDVKGFTSPQNPPVYISQVTYGRVVLVTFTSRLSEVRMKAAVEGAYAGFSGNAEAEHKEALAQMSMTVLSIGNTGEAIRQTIQAQTPDQAFNALRNLVTSGGRFSLANPGAPIAFTMNYVGSVAGQGANAAVIAQMVTDLSPEVIEAKAIPICRTFPVWDGPGGGPVNTHMMANWGDTVLITASGRNYSGVVGDFGYDPTGWYKWDAPGDGGINYPISDRSPFALIAKFGGQNNMGVDRTKQTYTERPGIPVSSWFYVGLQQERIAGYIDPQTKQGTPGTGEIWLGTNDNDPYNGPEDVKFSVQVCVSRRL